MVISLGNLSFSKTDRIDTDIGFDIEDGFAENHLYELLMEFRKSKVVVTDRLHGLIFSAITETPCVAFSSYNTKVKGAYEWLQHLPYLEYCEDVKNLSDKIKRVTTSKTKYCGTQINDDFMSLKTVLLDAYHII